MKRTALFPILVFHFPAFSVIIDLIGIKMKVSRPIFSFLLAVVVSSAVATKSALADDADAIIRSVADSLKPPRSFSALSKIDTYRNRVPSGSMTLRTYIRISRSSDGPHSISIVLSPEGERGKVFLRVNDAFWLYDPGAERPVKISTQQRLMGDASLADLTHFDLEESYSAALEGDESIVNASGEKVSAQRLQLKAKSRNALYPTLRLWVSGLNEQATSDNRMLPVKIECLSSTGRVLKTVYYSKFRGFLGKQRPTELTVVDGTAPGRVTRIRFSEFQYEEVDDSAYTTSAMPSVSAWAKKDRAGR